MKLLLQIRCGVRGGFQGIMATGASMTQLARALSPNPDVIDDYTERSGMIWNV